MKKNVLPILSALSLLVAIPLWEGAAGDAEEAPRKCIMVFGAHADDVEDIERPIIVDTKNLLDSSRLRAMGFQYMGVGRR